MISITATGILKAEPRTITPKTGDITMATLMVSVRSPSWKPQFRPLSIVATGEQGEVLAQRKAGDSLKITGTLKLSESGRPIKVVVEENVKMGEQR